MGVLTEAAVSRMTATKYLEALVEGGFVQKQKVGRGNHYVNVALVAILKRMQKLRSSMSGFGGG